MVGVLKIVTLMSEFEKSLIFKVYLAGDLNRYKMYIGLHFICMTVNVNLNSSTTTIGNTTFSLISLVNVLL